MSRYGRPRQRWEDNIKTHLTDLCCEAVGWRQPKLTSPSEGDSVHLDCINVAGIFD